MPNLFSSPVGSQSLNLPKNRLDFIAALRGFAALFVFSYHLALLPNPDLILPRWSSKFILTGGTGVTLFFVVSAFTLTLSMRLRENEPNAIMQFYIRRIFRIVPLFYMWIVLSLIRDKLMFGLTHTGGTVFLNMIFGFNFVPGKNEGIVWASWTLGVEMLFYLIFPLMYHYINDIWKAIGAFFVTLTISSIYTFLISTYLSGNGQPYKSFLQFSFLHQLPTFMIGILVYFIYERYILNKAIPPGLAFLLICLSIFTYSALLDGRLQFLLDGLYWQAIVFGMFLLGLSILPFKIFVNRLSGFFGEISYSFYLNHPTVILLFAPFYKAVYQLELPKTFLFGICFFFTISLLTLLSYGTYRLVERPGLRLGSKAAKFVRNKAVLVALETPRNNEVH